MVVLLSHADQVKTTGPDSGQANDAQSGVLDRLNQFGLTEPAGNATTARPVDRPPVGGIDRLLEVEPPAGSQYPRYLADLPSPVVSKMQRAEPDNRVIGAVADRQRTHLSGHDGRTGPDPSCSQGDHDRVKIDGMRFGRVHRAKKQVDANATPTSEFQNSGPGERTAEPQPRRRGGAGL